MCPSHTCRSQLVRSPHFSSSPCTMTHMTGVGTPPCRSAIGRALVLECASHSTWLCHFQRKEAEFQKLTEASYAVQSPSLRRGCREDLCFQRAALEDDRLAVSPGLRVRPFWMSPQLLLPETRGDPGFKAGRGRTRAPTHPHVSTCDTFFQSTSNPSDVHRA